MGLCLYRRRWRNKDSRSFLLLAFGFFKEYIHWFTAGSVYSLLGLVIYFGCLGQMFQNYDNTRRSGCWVEASKPGAAGLIQGLEGTELPTCPSFYFYYCLILI